MSENRDRGIQDLTKYDAMATEALEEILRQDAEAPEDQESDTEVLLYIMGVLAERRKRNGSTGKTALEAYESFKQNYLPEVQSTGRKAPKLPRWLRSVAAAAAVIVLVVCVPLTAGALGWRDIWDVAARWAKETFSFVSADDAQTGGPVAEDDLQYTSLQDLLERNKVDIDLAPAWIPDGYVLDKVEKDETPMKELYTALYSSGDKHFGIRVQSHLNNDSENYEVNDELLEIYKVSDVEYYIFSNMDQTRAVWIKDSYECNISGDLSVEEVKAMIDSIGKG